MIKITYNTRALPIRRAVYTLFAVALLCLAFWLFKEQEEIKVVALLVSLSVILMCLTVYRDLCTVDEVMNTMIMAHKLGSFTFFKRSYDLSDFGAVIYIARPGRESGGGVELNLVLLKDVEFWKNKLNDKVKIFSTFDDRGVHLNLYRRGGFSLGRKDAKELSRYLGFEFFDFVNPYWE